MLCLLMVVQRDGVVGMAEQHERAFWEWLAGQGQQDVGQAWLQGEEVLEAEDGSGRDISVLATYFLVRGEVQEGCSYWQTGKTN